MVARATCLARTPPDPGVHADAVGQLLQPADAGLFKDLHAQLCRCPGQSRGQFGRMDHGGPVLVPTAGEVGGRIHRRAHRIRVKENPAPAFAPKPFNMVRFHGHAELARALEVAIDLITLHGLLDPVQVFHSQPLQLLQFLGPAVLAVLVAMRQARNAEPAIAAGRGPADALRLDARSRRVPGCVLWPAGPSTGRCSPRPLLPDRPEAHSSSRGYLATSSPRSSIQNGRCTVSAKDCSTIAEPGKLRSKTVVCTEISPISECFVSARGTLL